MYHKTARLGEERLTKEVNPQKDGGGRKADGSRKGIARQRFISCLLYTSRQGYRSGHYSRNLTTTSGDVTLKVPKLKGISFETAIIERYRRRESSVEEALIEMYLAGVSVRRVEDITEALWGSKVSPATISELNKKAYVHIDVYKRQPLYRMGYRYIIPMGV